MTYFVQQKPYCPRQFGRIWDRRLSDSADIVIKMVTGMRVSGNVYAKRRDAVELVIITVTS